MTIQGRPGPQPYDPLPLEWLLRPLAPLTQFCNEADWFWDRMPRWFQPLRGAYRDWFLRHTLAVKLERAFERGIGVFATQFPAGTEATTVVAWFEQQILASTPTRIPPLDTVFCYVYRSPAVAGSPITEMIGVWKGEASRWWAEGADAVAALVPAEHEGLHILISRVSDQVAAAFQPAPRV